MVTHSNDRNFYMAVRVKQAVKKWPLAILLIEAIFIRTTAEGDDAFVYTSSPSSFNDTTLVLLILWR